MAQRYRKDVREAIEEAEKLGFQIVETGGSNKKSRHIKMCHENGGVIFFPKTPSAPSWRKNQRADARRVARDGRRNDRED